ncbi:unnamed protein product [Caretta caretta]
MGEYEKTMREYRSARKVNRCSTESFRELSPSHPTLPMCLNLEGPSPEVRVEVAHLILNQPLGPSLHFLGCPAEGVPLMYRPVAIILLGGELCSLPSWPLLSGFPSPVPQCTPCKQLAEIQSRLCFPKELSQNPGHLGAFPKPLQCHRNVPSSMTNTVAAPLGSDVFCQAPPS